MARTITLAVLIEMAAAGTGSTMTATPAIITTTKGPETEVETGREMVLSRP
jgi:hypothetical protein